MQVLTTLGVVTMVLGGFAWLCPRLAAWTAERLERLERPAAISRPAGAVRLTARLRRPVLRRPERLLPEGHRPPPGLGPLSPSERFLTQEAARGLRELQLYLLDARAA